MTKRNSRPPARAAASPGAGPKLLAGGNPQIPMGHGDAPVQAYIAAMPGWKRGVGQRLDALITRTMPDLRKAVKWNSPLYGAGGAGPDNHWVLSLRCYTTRVTVAFFRGALLHPVPPGPSKAGDTRYFDIRQNDMLDEAQFADWVKQARLLPGVKL